LPTDPRIRELQPLQFMWILSNMMEDSSAGKKEGSESFTMDDEDFKNMVKQIRGNKNG